MGENAPSQLVLYHYPELKEDKGVVLMTAEMDPKFIVSLAILYPCSFGSRLCFGLKTIQDADILSTPPQLRLAVSEGLEFLWSSCSRLRTWKYQLSSQILKVFFIITSHLGTFTSQPEDVLHCQFALEFHFLSKSLEISIPRPSEPLSVSCC